LLYLGLEKVALFNHDFLPVILPALFLELAQVLSVVIKLTDSWVDACR